MMVNNGFFDSDFCVPGTRVTLVVAQSSVCEPSLYNVINGKQKVSHDVHLTCETKDAVSLKATLRT